MLMHTRMYVCVMCVCVICLYCNIFDIHKAQRQKAVIPRLELFCAASNPHLCRSLGPHVHIHSWHSLRCSTNKNIASYSIALHTLPWIKLHDMSHGQDNLNSSWLICARHPCLGQVSVVNSTCCASRHYLFSRTKGWSTSPFIGVVYI